MESIAKNTKVSDAVMDRYKKHGVVTLYPCYENDCNQIDLVYNDNGCNESYTLDPKQANGNSRLYKLKLRGGEMTLTDGTFLEDIEIMPDVCIDKALQESINDFVSSCESSNNISGMCLSSNRRERYVEIIAKTAGKFHKKMNCSILMAEQTIKNIYDNKIQEPVK
ncbi:MAG: hypothetical protein ACUZ8H_14025 [Candidatus Anammoxibacter sp.]